MSNTNQTALFPVPTKLSSRFAPAFWPGITRDSTVSLQKVLEDNHKWHIFFNEKRFHNHIAHQVLTKWSMGATAEIIQAAYEFDSDQKRPAPSAEPITIENFVDHLSESDYYSSYLAFFTDQLAKYSASDVIEKYIFSKEFNFIPGRSSDKQPRMLDRFLSGLLHPIIHVGFGLEFGLRGTLAEGLAETAVHRAQANSFYSESLWDGQTPGIVGAVSKLVLDDTVISSRTESPAGPHVFGLLAKILSQDKFKSAVSDGESLIGATDADKSWGNAINELCEAWDVDGSHERQVERKLEELLWMNVVIYGAGGYKPNGNFEANFYTMHLVTSSLFLSSVSEYIKPHSRKLLFKSYLKMSLLVWLMVGRPPLNIVSLMKETNSHPLALEPSPTPSKNALPKPDHPHAVTPNAWLPIVESSLVHPDDHVIKLQRALAHYASLFGTRAAGEKDFSESGLKGAELLDGTLFIRVSYLTADRLGRVREGKEEGSWE